MKKKILFLIHLHGSIHGQSLVNQSIVKSKKIKKNFATQFVDIATSSSINDIESFRFIKIFKSINIFFRLFKSLIFFKPDKVYISISVLGWGFIKDSILVIICKLLGFKLIFHIHRKGVNKIVIKSFIYKFYYKFIFKNVEVIHLSKNLFYDLKKIIDPDSKNFIVNNGTKKQSLKNFKKDKIFNFIFIANLFKLKGIYILLKAILLLNKKKIYKKFKINIIGSLTRDFKQKDLNNFLYQNRKFNNVNFIGPKYSKKKFEYLSRSHAMVYPTKDDCFPLCILEAMSCGLPVISTYQGAISEMIKINYNGILIKSVKAPLLANAMKIYIENSQILKVHSKNSQKYFNQKYTINSFEKNLINVLYKTLMSN
tara:strand:+ start:688 stop:1794 length:1107 start_codon:yes stop_codon:yes gene_type:complete